MVTDEQLAKLPRYARWEIERLRHNEEYALKIAEDAKAGFMARGVIRSGVRDIRFTVTSRGLEMAADDGVLYIEPRASNLVILHNRPFGER